MLDKLTIEHFEALIDHDIELRFGEQVQEARVVEITQRGQPPEDGREPFNVILESGSNDGYWPQGVHTLVHPEHGELPLFMVPLGPGEAGMRYEIVIN